MYSNLKVEESTIVFRQELPEDKVISLQRIKPLASYHYEAKVISAADARRKHDAVGTLYWGVTAEEAIEKAIKSFNSNS